MEILSLSRRHDLSLHGVALKPLARHDVWKLFGQLVSWVEKLKEQGTRSANAKPLSLRVLWHGFEFCRVLNDYEPFKKIECQPHHRCQKSYRSLLISVLVVVPRARACNMSGYQNVTTIVKLLTYSKHLCNSHEKS